MSARDDYPELDRITTGVGVEIIEDAEDQAERALNEIDRLRADQETLIARRDELMRVAGRRRLEGSLPGSSALSNDEKLSAERTVRLLRAKAAELEADVKDALARDPNNTLAYLTADIALIAGLLADHIDGSAT